MSAYALAAVGGSFVIGALLGTHGGRSGWSTLFTIAVSLTATVVWVLLMRKLLLP